MNADIVNRNFMHLMPAVGRNILLYRFKVSSEYLARVLNFMYFSFTARQIRHVAINELGCAVYKKIKSNP